MNLKILGAGLAGACAALALLIAPAQSEAYKRFGTKWPGGKVTYYNNVKGYDPAVKAAVSAWNHSGAKVKFKRTSKKKARVQIGYMKDSTCRGLTRLPRARRTTHARVYLPAPSSPEVCRDIATLTIVAAHEFGHVIGLNHETKQCATMNPSGNRDGGALCDPTHTTPPWLWRCRILEPDDVRGAIKTYGGKFRASKFFASPLCPLYGPPPPVIGLTASDSGTGNLIRISLTRPADGIVPDYLAREFAGGVPFTYVAYAAGACPPITSSTRYSWGAVPVGGALTGTINGPALTPGTTYCVSIWAADAIGQPSAPASVNVTIT